MFARLSLNVLSLSILIAPFSNSVFAYQARSQGSRANIAPQELSQEQQQSLVYMREEEKLARDVYLTLGEYWDLKIFARISGAEQRHMDRIGYLLDRYDILDPVEDDTRGIFTNTSIANLYTSLVQRGQESREAALQVGAEIEELDIADLQNALDKEPPKDIERIYTNLLRGSHNHLRAFVSTLQNNAYAYSPRHLDAAEVQTIMNSENERGNKGNWGQHRQGKRRGQSQSQDQGKMRGQRGQGPCAGDF